MASDVKIVIYPVQDAARAKALFAELLGVEPYVDSPYYIGFRLGDFEVGLDPNGHKAGLSGALPYYSTSDIRATLRALEARGAEVQQDVKDVGGGLLIARVKDPEGNVIGLRQSP